MISNPDWLKPKEIPYIHQISMDCLEKMVDCMEKYVKGDIDTNTCFEMEEQILTEKINDPEFLEYAIENFSEMMGYIASGRTNIMIHRDFVG